MKGVRFGPQSSSLSSSASSAALRAMSIFPQSCVAPGTKVQNVQVNTFKSTLSVQIKQGQGLVNMVP